MTSPLIAALSAQHRLTTVDETDVDAFLTPAAGEAAHTLLFFTGDPTSRSETLDVAVVMPEILAAFQRRLRGAVVARSAEAALMPRFRVAVLPSLVVTRGGEPVAVLPKIRDWSDYVATIGAALAPDAPVVPAEARPRTAFTHTTKHAEPGDEA